tara:strand:- start:262 stop:558 length:297 start_codon:yes stop_codon:yes gene_type:complete
MVSNSRYNTYAASVRELRGKPYNDLVSSDNWKMFLTVGLEEMDYKIAMIPLEMEGRPDLIANAAYGNKNLWWLVCTANGIIDPSTELTSGKQITLPII